MRTETRALVALAIQALVGAAACAQPFAPTSIGALGPGPGTPAVTASAARGINNAHVVVGSSTSPTLPGGRAVSWTQGGGLVALPGVASPFVRPFTANAVNASGQMVGGGETINGVRAISTVGGVTTNLGTLSPLLSSIANGVNAQGDVVGTCWDQNFVNPSFGFIHRNGVMSQAGPLGEAWDINASGFVAGHGGSVWQARLWDSVGNTFTPLGTLGGNQSRAFAVNASNQVVGWASTGTGAWNAYVWTSAFGMTDLNISGQLGPGDSVAWDINDAGEIVGDYGLTGSRRAFYSRNGVATDLNSWLPSNSGWVLTSARGINDQGCIVGTGLLNGEQRGYVMCVPAPGSLALVGLGGVLCVRRRR